MKKNSCMTILFAFTVAVLLSPPSFALMMALTTEQITKGAELIIEGEVEEVSSLWSDDGKTIVTRAVVRTNEVIKGKETQSRTVVEYPGGEVGDIGLEVSDISPLRKGEKVILFLRPLKSENGMTVYAVVSKGQGKYIVGEDGIARKNGFSVINGKEGIDFSIPVGPLKEKIRRME